MGSSKLLLYLYTSIRTDWIALGAWGGQKKKRHAHRAEDNTLFFSCSWWSPRFQQGSGPRACRVRARLGLVLIIWGVDLRGNEEPVMDDMEKEEKKEETRRDK